MILYEMVSSDRYVAGSNGCLCKVSYRRFVLKVFQNFLMECLYWMVLYEVKCLGTILE